jgi:hypothetical protein
MASLSSASSRVPKLGTMPFLSALASSPLCCELLVDRMVWEYTDNVHIRDTDIQLAASRGILGRPSS